MNSNGTVFQVSLEGKLTTLHKFGGSDTTLYSFNGTHASVPFGGLVQGSDRSFYGTTAHGGSSQIVPWSGRNVGQVRENGAVPARASLLLPGLGPYRCFGRHRNAKGQQQSEDANAHSNSGWPHRCMG
jgi:hypothetical protein